MAGCTSRTCSGAAILAVVAGLIRDTSGTYTAAFVFAGWLAVVAGLAALAIKRPGPPPEPAPPAAPGRGSRMTARKKPPLGQSIGGVLFGFEQQVFRNQPPPHELVHRARPDSAVAAGDGSLLTIELPDDADRRTTMTDAQIRELTEQPTVAVRIRQPRAETDMGQLFGRYLPLIGGRLAASGVEIAGAPFGRYHQWGPDQVDVEIGIPVAAPPAGAAGPGCGRSRASPARRRCPAGRRR